jgi:hypothetical protein
MRAQNATNPRALLCPFLFFCLVHRAVKHNLHGHVGLVENGSAVRDVPVPSDPLAHTGGVTSRSPHTDVRARTN